MKNEKERGELMTVQRKLANLDIRLLHQEKSLPTDVQDCHHRALPRRLSSQAVMSCLTTSYRDNETRASASTIKGACGIRVDYPGCLSIATALDVRSIYCQTF